MCALRSVASSECGCWSVSSDEQVRLKMLQEVIGLVAADKRAQLLEAKDGSQPPPPTSVLHIALHLSDADVSLPLLPSSSTHRPPHRICPMLTAVLAAPRDSNTIMDDAVLHGHTNIFRYRPFASALCIPVLM